MCSAWDQGTCGFIVDHFLVSTPEVLLGSASACRSDGMGLHYVDPTTFAKFSCGVWDLLCVYGVTHDQAICGQNPAAVGRHGTV